MITPALERLILAQLAAVFPHMVTEDSLYIEVNTASAVPVTRVSLISALQALQQRSQVTRVGGDDGARFRIAPEGQARLAELNISIPRA